MARFDTALFDEALFDTESSSTPTPVDTSTFKIDSYSLQNTEITVNRFTYSSAKYNASIKYFPRADGGYLESGQFQETRLLLRGSLREATATLLEAQMDLMRQAFARGSLLMAYWNGERRYWEVVPTGIDSLFADRTGQDITWSPWQIELLCIHPYARSAGRDTFSGTDATSSPTVYELSNGGTAPTESIIVLTIVTAGTLSKFSWENGETGETITIDNTTAFSDGDTITINTEDKTVKKNGTAVDYTGLLPRLNPGSNSCTFTAITGTGFDVAVTERHYRRFY